jgi:NitT/TauT family transport system ATP-binding protein
VPTTYPKCSPNEVTGLLVLLKDHKGSEDVALLADDLDLEIDEILPALEYAEVLQLLRVSDGRATLTEVGTQLLAGSIRERKTQLRDQLKKTTLYKALLRALESSPEHRLTEEEVNRLIAFTTAPADEYVQNIINWGRYTELFRYDADQRVLLPVRSRAGRQPPGSEPPSEGGNAAAVSDGGAGRPRAPADAKPPTGGRLAPLATVTG